MITSMYWGVGVVPGLLMLWPNTSSSGTMKVHLLRLMVRPLAASTAKNWSILKQSKGGDDGSFGDVSSSNWHLVVTFDEVYLAEDGAALQAIG